MPRGYIQASCRKIQFLYSFTDIVRIGERILKDKKFHVWHTEFSVFEAYQIYKFISGILTQKTTSKRVRTCCWRWTRAIMNKYMSV